jgi:hypothetical protein
MSKLTLDEAIKHCLEVAEEQSRFYSLCPHPCDGTKDCMSLKNGKDMGCVKCATEHRQLAEWLKELKEWRANPFYQIKTECKNNYYCNKCAFLDHCPFSNGNRVAAEYPMDWVVY